MSQPDIETSESACRVISLVGQLACIEAEGGNRGAIRVASRCYVELKRKKLEVPAMLEDFILARLDMVADGESKEAFPIGRANHPPRQFDGLGFVIALVREWAKSDVPSSDFDKFFRAAVKGELGDRFGTKPNGEVFDIKTFQRSITEHLPEVLSLLSIEANLGHK